MPYAVLQDLINRYGEPMLIQLSDRAVPPANVIDEAVIASEIDNAGATIDGYLKGRYQLPLTATPPLLKELTVSIACYKLHGNTVSEKVRLDYEDAMRQLREFAAGTIRLDVAGVEPAGSGDGGARFTDRARPLDQCSLKGFV